MIAEEKLIKIFKIFGIPVLSIRYNGLFDVYRLFDKWVIYYRENDRYFWDDWE